MKKYFKSRKSCIFILFIALIGSVFFSSCENFLKGSEVKRKLDEAIKLANTPSFNIEINLKNALQGSITPNGNFSVKQGQTYTIEFRKNNDFEFQGFEVLDRTSLVPIINAVEIKNIQQESIGYITIIKADIKILERNEKILIRPKCKNLRDNIKPEIINEISFAKSRQELIDGNLLDINYVFNPDSKDSEVNNHVKDTLYFSLEVHEEDSSISCIKVIETPIQNENRIAITPKKMEYTINDIELEETKFGFFCNFEYKIAAVHDGFIKIEFCVLDDGENESLLKSVYVLKDTKQNALAYIEKLFEDPDDRILTEDQLKNFYILNDDDSATTDFTFYVTPEKYEINSKSLPINFSYKYACAKNKEDLSTSSLQDISQTFIEKVENYGGYEWYKFTGTFNIPQVLTNTYLMLCVFDEVGNQRDFVFEIPGVGIPRYSYIRPNRAYNTIDLEVEVVESCDVFYHAARLNSFNNYFHFLNGSVYKTLYNPDFNIDDESTYIKSTDYYLMRERRYTLYEYDSSLGGKAIRLFGPIKKYTTDVIQTSLGNIEEEKVEYIIDGEAQNTFTIKINIDPEYYNSFKDCFFYCGSLDLFEKITTPAWSITLDKDYFNSSVVAYGYLYVLDNQNKYYKKDINIFQENVGEIKDHNAPTISYQNEGEDVIEFLEFLVSDKTAGNNGSIDYTKKASVRYETVNTSISMQVPMFNLGNNMYGQVFLPVRILPNDEICKIYISAQDAAGYMSKEFCYNYKPTIRINYDCSFEYNEQAYDNNSEYHNKITFNQNNLQSKFFEISILKPSAVMWQGCSSSCKNNTILISSEAADDGFIRLSYFLSNNWTGYSATHTTPKYYYLKGKLAASVTDINELKSGIQIYSDVPFFVHTICSPVNWGENLEEWEDHCVCLKDYTGLESYGYSWNDLSYAQNEFSAEFINEDHSQLSYYYPFPKNIPPDMYYISIVHYADGTVLSSNIHKN